MRYLGVIIDTHLGWKHQCKSVVAKATRTFNVLCRTMFGCSNRAKSRAFCALVLPLLEYASPVWCPYSKQNINLLESVLHRGDRWVYNSRYDPLNHYWTPSASSCCTSLHWLPLSVRCDTSSLVMAHDIIHGGSCILQHFLPFSSRSRLHHLQCHQLSINSFLESLSCGTG